jgi:RNA polymerase sigma-70 factor (ECF subfamily)
MRYCPDWVTMPAMGGNSSDVGAMPALALPDDSAAFPKVPLCFEAVYEEHFPFVWRTARRLGVSPSSVDDVCQEVFVAVHRRLSEFEGRSSVKTWLFGILWKVVLMHRRSLARKSPAHRSQETPREASELPDQGPSPQDLAVEAEATRLAHQLLGELDDDKRTVFVLSELEDMSATEIAEAVGANVNTVYARLRAARQAFAAAVKRHRAKDAWRMK